MPLCYLFDGNALWPREPNTAQQKQADKTLQTKVITFINADGCKQSNQGQTKKNSFCALLVAQKLCRNELYRDLRNQITPR